MAVVFFSAVIALSAVFLTLPVMTLSLKQGAAGREVTWIHVGSGSQLEIEYLHSMYGVHQSEVFFVGQESVFHLKKVLFGSLAAALYYDPDPPSGLNFEDNSWVINGGGQCYPILRYRVGTATHHLLKVMNQTIDLSRLSAGTDGLIQMEIEKRTRLHFLFIGLRKKVVDALSGYEMGRVE
jgi:hypothetical protein